MNHSIEHWVIAAGLSLACASAPEPGGQTSAPEPPRQSSAPAGGAPPSTPTAAVPSDPSGFLSEATHHCLTALDASAAPAATVRELALTVAVLRARCALTDPELQAFADVAGSALGN